MSEVLTTVDLKKLLKEASDIVIRRAKEKDVNTRRTSEDKGQGQS